MMYKVLRFIGAIVVSVIFAYLVDVFHLIFFAGAAHFFGNLSWTNWLSFDILRGAFLPIVWGLIWLVGICLCWLIKGVKWMSVLPIFFFILKIINDFSILFLNPLEDIVADIGQGVGYYIGAIVTFFFILACYGVCLMGMFVSDKD